MRIDAGADAILYQMPRALLKKRGSAPRHRARGPDTRRTTLTLPAPLLRRAEQLARERHQTLSTVIAGLLQEGLRPSIRAEREASILAGWRKRVFVPANEEEALLLQGIVLQDPDARSK